MEIPDDFVCPISQEIMIDPFRSIYGHSFERNEIHRWLMEKQKTCPITRQPLTVTDLVPNDKLREQIRQWIRQNDPYGMDELQDSRLTDYDWMTHIKAPSIETVEALIERAWKRRAERHNAPSLVYTRRRR